MPKNGRKIDDFKIISIYIFLRQYYYIILFSININSIYTIFL